MTITPNSFDSNLVVAVRYSGMASCEARLWGNDDKNTPTPVWLKSSKM